MSGLPTEDTAGSPVGPSPNYVGADVISAHQAAASAPRPGVFTPPRTTDLTGSATTRFPNLPSDVAPRRYMGGGSLEESGLHPGADAARPGLVRRAGRFLLGLGEDQAAGEQPGSRPETEPAGHGLEHEPVDAAEQSSDHLVQMMAEHFPSVQQPEPVPQRQPAQPAYDHAKVDAGLRQRISFTGDYYGSPGRHPMEDDG